MRVIEQKMGSDIDEHQRDVALAASLVHDVGHGMFSHSFEDVGKKLDFPMARHEQVSETLIRHGEIAEMFKELGSGFANDVADVLGRREPANLYESVVSSQFDADRLDYMQRDRLMTGVQSSGIDATWLMSNLEIGSVPVRADDEPSDNVHTLVLGPKAFYTAENYVLSLFQLYPNVYLHKTTRAAEKLFSCLIHRIFELIYGGHEEKTGLPVGHPIRNFAKDPSEIRHALALDDSVFWGALHMMVDAGDPLIRNCSLRLQTRRLPKCIDIGRRVSERETTDMNPEEKLARLRLAKNEIVRQIQTVAAERRFDQPQIFVDEARRTPYKKSQESHTLLDLILIKHGEDRFEDMANLSRVVESAETFEVCRAYCDMDDEEGRNMIESVIETSQPRENG